MHLLCMMWMVLRQMMRARGRERERDIKSESTWHVGSPISSVDITWGQRSENFPLVPFKVSGIMSSLPIVRN